MDTQIFIISQNRTEEMEKAIKYPYPVIVYIQKEKKSKVYVNINLYYLSFPLREKR